MEMNWKDYPHIFANGKFKIKYVYFDEEIIEVLDGDTADGVKKYDEQDYSLIARKIDSMSDDEEKQFDELQEEMNLGNWYFPHPECFLFLLSKGIYPFSQSHFGETVIDIKTIEK